MKQYIIVCLVCVFSFLQSTGATMAAETYSTDPKEFMEVPQVYSGKKLASSPARPSDKQWAGIILAAPQKIIVHPVEQKGELATYARFPVSLYYSFLSGSYDIQHVITPEIVVRNIKTNQEYKGAVRQLDDSRRSIPHATGNGIPAKMGGYSSYNILNFVTLPLEPATYEVWLIMGNSESNKCTVDVRIEK